MSVMRADIVLQAAEQWSWWAGIVLVALWSQAKEDAKE